MIVAELSSTTSPRLAAVATTATVGIAAKALSQLDVGMLVVCNEGGPVAGVLSKSDLVRHLAPRNLAPPVLTNNLSVTVGGTLAIAGIGVSSFKYGTQGDNVRELEVVTGTGERLVCDRKKHADLFWGRSPGWARPGSSRERIFSGFCSKAKISCSMANS